MAIPRHFTTEGPWRHPGGKLLRSGPNTLTDAELLAIIISSGSPRKPAEQIAQELIEKFQSFRGMAEQDVKEFMKIKAWVRSKSVVLQPRLRLLGGSLIRYWRSKANDPPNL